jgi:predicted phosphate transport protein (TIGR00153 family)
MSQFHNIIAKSPFDILKEHIKISYKSVELLNPFIQAAMSEDWNLVKEYKVKISELESTADSIKTEMRSHLHKGLYLPVSRSEILSLIKTQDKMPNIAEDIAGLVLGRKIIIPKEIQEEFLKLLTHVVKTSEIAKQATKELAIFFASGFSGNISDVLEEMLFTITKMEHLADTYEVNVRNNLLQIEMSLNPIEVMFLYKLVEFTGRIADSAESIGDRISLLLAN